ncbi:unnamed protein product [Phaedon cochleariae]|uniref:Cadherin domain-containing protein n=1 Tax=Phaedon cochleariae TaxID=80249 RepID=A0A9P0DP92_PHACE|nr:unnamed protein product [Phaedon cochleariae]
MKKNKDRPPIVLLLTLLLQIIVPSVGQGISVEQVNGDVTITKDGTVTIMTMDENNHDFTERTPLIRFVNVKEVTFQQFVDYSFRYTLMDESDNKTNKILYSDQSFDYETQPNNYVMTLFVDGLNGDKVPSFVLKLTINNIDDEPPTMSCPQCRFDENTMYTLENTTCSCVVTDSDGWLNKMTFDVLPDGTTGEEGSIFLFEFREKPDDQLKTANVQMYLGKELKYNETSFYLFNIQARDGAGHETIPNNVTMAIVDVNDLRDTPPVWTKFIAFQQFEEQLEKDFQISARDGDVGLNKDICYSKVREDDEEAKYIHIDERTGTVHVSKIDRDKKDITMYKSEISAFVCEEPDWRTSQVMSFYIIDIDNNSPLVIWVFDYEKNNNTYDGETSKSTSLKFYENYAGSLNTTIFIKDIDTGDNAQFFIELENSGGDIDFTKAFMVVPTAGYRSSEFQLNVKNATYLDYEDPSWRHIKFNVLSRGTKNRDHLDRLLVDIQLQDYNDEIPKFELMEYNATISEATKKDVVITTVLATDADYEDKILKHNLIGSEYALQVLGIKSDTGEIYVKTDDAFDYDTVNPIFVQVRATDKVGHTATVPLTIDLTDVNNKAPTIDVGNPISVEENKEVEFNLDSTIAASDIDTNASLTVKIDWDGSYATKNSRRLNMTDETIAREVKFLNVKFEGKYNGYYKNRTIDIGLEVNNHPKYPAPDYELFDSLYLKLIVTDLNTDEEFLRNEKSSALIVVSIIDINDNTPVFVEPENSNRTVQEKAVIGTSAGSIVAIDLDVNDNVTYECKALSPETDWLEVDTKSGVFIVKDGHINADPDTFTFSYNCTATDTVHISDTLKVDFYIIDGNNRIPELNISDTVNLLERPDDDAIVIDMTKQIRDLDRDVPFHTVVCIFSDSCNDKFYIKNNIIRVRKGEEIDRDTKERNFTCSITCSDNPNGWRGEPSLSSPPFTLIIFVDDINNFIPELDMDDFDCYENLEKNAEIHEIIGKDLDAKENGTIDFNITSVINEETGEDIASIFAIFKDDSDYEVNETHKRVHLIASEDLRGYYGTYDITFGLSDEGEPQNSQLQSRKFTIKKYNFESPRFVFPAENEILQLMSVQTLDSPLVVFRERASLQDFEIIADSKDKDCSKWKIKFSITQLEPTSEETVFKLVDKHPCISQLQINDAFNSDRVVEKIFKIQISAWIDAESSPDTNEAPYYTKTNITIRFYNNYQQPTFDQSFRKWTIEFEEGNDALSEKLKENATYEITDDPNLNIYYYIVPGKNETIERIFEVDRDSGMVSVKEKFYYDFDKQFEFKIVASNDTHPNSTDPDSFLDVCVEVQPANLRTPVWSRDFFFGAIMPGFLSSTIIVSADVLYSFHGSRMNFGLKMAPNIVIHRIKVL